MWNYYCLRFKNETQWNNAKTQFKVDSRKDIVQYDLPTIWYEESYLGPKSTKFHVNIAIRKRKLPQKAWPFVVKPVFQKCTMNGSGLHEMTDAYEKANFLDIDDAKIFGEDVTGPQLATLADEPDFSEDVV